MFGRRAFKKQLKKTQEKKYLFPIFFLSIFFNLSLITKLEYKKIDTIQSKKTVFTSVILTKEGLRGAVKSCMIHMKYRGY